MKISLICVGKIKEEFYRKMIENNAKEIRKYAEFSLVEVQDWQTKENCSDRERQIILEEEGKQIVKYLQKIPGRCIVTLEIEGKTYDEAGWMKEIQRRMEKDEVREFVYVIGGSLGLSQEVISHGDVHLSLGSATFPHQLMRVMLLERIATWHKS